MLFRSRRVVALTCPEPYCDHVQHLPRGMAQLFEQEDEPRYLKQAN